MPGQKWTTESELKLLLTIIEVTDPKPPSWSVIATAMGPGFTAEAVRQKFANIKKGVKSTLHATSTPTSTPTKSTTTATPPTATSTPTKTKTKTPTTKDKTKPKPKRKSRNPPMALSSSEDEDEDETPPAKKIKIEPEANTAAVADRVEVFKTEHPADHTFEEEEEEGPGDGMVVDLENEGLYEGV